MQSTDRDLSIGEAADLMNVSKKTVYRLIVAGKLAHYLVGRKIRITRAALDAYRGVDDAWNGLSTSG